MHCIASIHHEIKQRRLELIGIDLDCAKPRRHLYIDRNRRPKRTPHQFQHAGHQAGKIGPLRLEVLPAGKSEHARSERAPAPRAFGRGIDQTQKTCVVWQPLAQ